MKKQIFFINIFLLAINVHSQTIDEINDHILKTFEDAPDFSYANPQASADIGYQIQFRLKSYISAEPERGAIALADSNENFPRLLMDEINNIAAFDNNEKARNFLGKDVINRILLVGPPGTGKSTLAKAIAYYCKRDYLFISSATLCNEFKNASIRIIDTLFDTLECYNIPCVLILDEITAFTARANNPATNGDPGGVEHFWIHLDQLKNNSKILIIFTANSTEQIPDTIKDRFAGCEFFIDFPCKEFRRKIIKNSLAQHFYFEATFLDYIAEATAGLSLRELTMIVKRSKNNALSRNRLEKNYDWMIKEEDIQKALDSILTQHSKKNSEKQWDNFKKTCTIAGPYIIPALSFLAGLYFQYQYSKHQESLLTQSMHA